MKILYVLKSLNPKDGGIVHCVCALMEQHSKTGIEAEVVCLDSPSAYFINESSFKDKIHALGELKSTYAFSPTLLKWLFSHIRNYSAVVINGLWQFHGFAASRIARIYKIPYFVFSHGMLDSSFKKNYPIKHFKKLFYWFLVEKSNLNHSHRVIFTSLLEKECSINTFPFLRAPSALLTLGIEYPNYPDFGSGTNFLNGGPIPERRFYILFLSRIHEKKGCDILLKSFQIIKSKVNIDIHLIMAGPGEASYLESLQALSEQLGLHDDVTWTGMVTGSAKWKLFFLADAFILPSHHENFGIAIAEALSCGLPVLISNKINIFTEVIDYGCGFVATDDVEGTVNNLQNWLSLSASEKFKMRLRALQCFEENFRIADSERRLVNIIESAI